MTEQSPYRFAADRLTNTFFWIAFVMCLMALGWLGVVGYQLSSNAIKFRSAELSQPSFNEYRRVARLDTLPVAPPEIGGLGLERARSASALQIFEWIGDFENGRSSQRLRTINPLVSGLVLGGLAETVGIRPGDEIISVNGSAVDSVYAVYEMLDQRGDQVSTLILRRAGRLFSASLVAPAGQVVNAENSGLLFKVPQGLNLVFRGHVRSLADQFVARFLDRLAPEWRASYLQGLAEIVIQLQPYIESQTTLTSAEPGFISIEQMLLWYHESFTQAIERHTRAQRELSVAQVAALGRFGDAVLGLVSSMALLGLAFLLRRVRAGEAGAGQ